MLNWSKVCVILAKFHFDRQTCFSTKLVGKDGIMSFWVVGPFGINIIEIQIIQVTIFIQENAIRNVALKISAISLGVNGLWRAKTQLFSSANRHNMNRNRLQWTPYGVIWFCQKRGVSTMAKCHMDGL